MCTSSNGVDVRNDGHWRFATTCEPIRRGPRSEALKRTIAAQAVAADPESREQYAVTKTAFVDQVVALAIAQGYPSDLSDQ